MKNPAAPAMKREAEEDWGGNDGNEDARDLFAQTDQQVSTLKDRIAQP
jgi:hypothetical protein